MPTVHRVMLRISNLVTTRATSGGMSLAVAFLALIPSQLVAGGPKYVAGVNFFNPGVVGQPVRWQSGLVQYFVDQGPLNATVDHQQAQQWSMPPPQCGAPARCWPHRSPRPSPPWMARWFSRLPPCLASQPVWWVWRPLETAVHCLSRWNAILDSPAWNPDGRFCTTAPSQLGPHPFWLVPSP